MSWKPVLYEYVRSANQREADYGLPETSVLVTDRHYRDLEQQRLKRLRARHAERGAKPVGNDTALKLRNVREFDRTVIADIDLRRKAHLRTRGVEHTEERVDRERITLSQSAGGNWNVTRVESIVPERTQISGTPAVFSASPETVSVYAGTQAQSVPYLNERVMRRSNPPGRERAYLYDREAAKAYADRHWNEPSTQYIHFDVDCTNYVSQCLYAGGAPMNYTGKREMGWWYKGKSGGRELWSFSWSVAHALQRLLYGSRAVGLRAQLMNEARELTIGDVICYDFDGDGRFEHSTIVTGADGAGEPLVNAHTTNSKARFWDYQDSYAWTERTQYRFFRIQESF